MHEDVHVDITIDNYEMWYTHAQGCACIYNFS